jgi:hypothetical protein
MGYELHITRASEWTESEDHPILLPEWLTYLASDVEFRLDNFAEAKAPSGDVLRYENEGLAVWLPEGGWFDYRRGRIVVKNPSNQMIEKMKHVALALKARVVGDEGEEY